MALYGISIDRVFAFKFLLAASDEPMNERGYPGVSKSVTIVDPRGEFVSAQGRISPRVGGLAGRRIAFIDNSKKNASLLLDRLEERLRDEFPLAGVLRKRKPRTMAADFVEEVKEKAEVAVNAVGD